MMNSNKTMLAILKEFSKGNTLLNANSFMLDTDTFVSILNQMKEEGLIRNFGVLYADDKVCEIYLEDVMVTLKGIEYLQKSKWTARLYETLKEIKFWAK